MSEESKKQNYSADSIQALEGMEHVRMRPSMYIGDVGVRGLHHLVYEVVDNSIDEAMGGYCDTIGVAINEDGSITVEDNGRGIPVDMHKKEGVSALEVVMTKIGAGGKFDKDSYKVSGGLHGVGVSVVNALSNHLRATVHREGKVYEQEYERGKALFPVKQIGETEKRGTIVTFYPDDTIFTQTTEFSYDTLSARMRELSFLNKGITITFT
ncbi:MAG: DNA topoisomerase IV subunit B, partial [Flavobacterium sp.]|nr:DNA topoisomerase IV subunit B [Flavobacterium sp.]